MMKILWISHLLPYPPQGGVRIRSYKLLREIGKYHSLYFVGLTQKAHQKNPKELTLSIEALNKFCTHVSVFPFESQKSQLGLYALAFKCFFSRTSYKEKWCRSEQIVKSVRWITENEEIDVVHFDTISLLQYYRILPGKIPIIINHHNIESNMMYKRENNERQSLRRLYFHREAGKLRRLEQKYCSKGTNLVVSALDEKRLRDMDEALDIEIIPNGVDLNYFRRVKVSPVENSLIFIGGLTWYPNIDAIEYFCKEIWPLLKKKVKDPIVFIVGNNPPKRLLNFAKNEKNLKFLGFIDDILPLMSSATAYICPMRTGGGTRLKVLDALAMGIPLIATRMACEGIPVKNGDHVLFAETPKEFVDQVTIVFDDPNLRERLRMNSRKLIEDEFDYVNIGIKLASCYSRASEKQIGSVAR